MNFPELRNVRKGQWLWRIENPAALEPWFEVYPKFESEAVKRNPVRSVFKVRDNSGAEYYVKHEIPKKIPGILRSLFRPKLYSEYRSWRLLHRLGIPCVRYLGWGRNFPESMLLSEALPDSTGAKEYWFRFAVNDPEQKRKFLQELSGITRKFVDARLLHGDFHAGNIVVHLPTQKLHVVDPYGIRQCRAPLSQAQKLMLARIYTNLRGELSQSEVISCFLAGGLAANADDAMILWNTALEIEEHDIRSDWKRRKGQILSGKSKFCRVSTEGGHRIFRRNTLWYAPMEIRLEDLRKEPYSHDRAEQLWLDSFLAQQMRQNLPEVPLAWEIASSGNSKDYLYFQF